MSSMTLVFVIIIIGIGIGFDPSDLVVVLLDSAVRTRNHRPMLGKEVQNKFQRANAHWLGKNKICPRRQVLSDVILYIQTYSI